MRLVKHILFLFLFTKISYSQSKREDIYFLFDAKSKENCLIDGEFMNDHPNRIDDYHIRIKKYYKRILKNEDIFFHICDEGFISYKNSPRDTLNISYLKKVKLTSGDKILHLMRNGDGEFFFFRYGRGDPGHLYFLEKINDNTLVKHDVSWEYEEYCM